MFFFRIYFPRSKVCLYPFVLLTDRIESDYLFSLFLQMMQFSSSSPFSVAAAPQWTDFISMLDRNKILSDQNHKIDIQPPVSKTPLLNVHTAYNAPFYLSIPPSSVPFIKWAFLKKVSLSQNKAVAFFKISHAKTLSHCG